MLLILGACVLEQFVPNRKQTRKRGFERLALLADGLAVALGRGLVLPPRLVAMTHDVADDLGRLARGG